MNKERNFALAALTGMSLLFGASFVCSKIALASFSPFELIFLRFAIGAVLYLLVSPWLKAKKLDRKGYGKIFLLALCEPFTYFILEAYGLQRTLASTAAILVGTIPVWVVVLEAIWMKVRVDSKEVTLIIASLAGIVLLVSDGGHNPLKGALTGNLLILAAALTAALYTVTAKKLLRSYDVITVSRLQTFYAVLLYLPLAGFDVARHGMPSASGKEWWAVVYLGVGCSFFAYILLNTALSKLRASLVAGFANIIPVVAVGLGWLMLGEHLGPLQGVGAVVVTTAVVLLSRRKPAPQRPAISSVLKP